MAAFAPCLGATALQPAACRQQRRCLAAPLPRTPTPQLLQTAAGGTPRRGLQAPFGPTSDQCKQHPAKGTACSAAAASAGASESGKDEGLTATLVLGLLFGGWYAANIGFNIYNKQVLKAFPFPLTATMLQFFVGSIITLAAWGSGLLKIPALTTATLTRVLPLAVVHTLGNLLTNMSLGAVAVSFTHTIKAMEPFFSVALSALFLGEYPSPLLLLTLVPIMGGVAIASMTEASFNWTGFLAAMGSNLTFQSRNVLSKKLMQAKRDSSGEAPLDNFALFGIITVLSLLLLLPVTLLLEGWGMTPASLAAMGVAEPQDLIFKATLAGLAFHTYQQVSYAILSRVSPVTHSIGNCVKRVVVIVASVVVFQNPVSAQNMAGTALALAGVFAYSQIKRRAKAKPQ